MKKNLVKAMETARYENAKRSNDLVSEYELIKKMEPNNIEAQNAKAIEAQEAYKKYMAADKDLKSYKELDAELESLYKTSLATKEGSEEEKEASEKFMKSLAIFNKYEDSLIKKYGVIKTVEEKKEEVEEVIPEKTSEEENEEFDESNEKKKTGKATKVIAGVLAIAAAAGLGYGLRGCSAKTQDSDTAIVDTDTEEELTGKYGQFKDVTNDEQVNARANYLYNTYFEQFRSKLTPTEQEMITPEKIANIIRVANGELPLDADGNKYFDANLTDDYIQALTKIIADLPSSPALDKIYNVPTHLFAVDGSDLSNFMMKYDEDYENIAEARNNRDGAKAQRAIASLGKKLWYEWSLQGMNYETDGKMSDYKSPFDLPAAQRALALNASVAKYGPYVFEYNLNAMQPVCIDACVDYYSKTMKKLTVNEIFVGVTSGEYDTVIAKAAGIEVDKEPDSIAFDQDLRDELEFKYKELKQMTLK